MKNIKIKGQGLPPGFQPVVVNGVVQIIDKAGMEKLKQIDRAVERQRSRKNLSR